MATKKDLVEAYSFSRRRLVTAFLSGAPGGREVEPTRPGRTIIGGVALAILLVAGAAVAGVLKPKTNEDWTQPGLIISEEKGAAYVILAEDDAVDAADDEVVLRPVANITSAQLILGSDSPPTTVPQKDIDAKTIGEDIGIAGAPQTVPETERLISTGWTACTDTGLGIKVTVSVEPQVSEAPGAGFLVRKGNRFYVIAEAAARDDATPPRAYRYALPQGDGNDNLLLELNLPERVAARRVPAEWLNLFPAGNPLDFRSLGLDGFGKRSDLAGTSGLPESARIGDYYLVEDETLVLTEKGPARFDDFALAVYLNSELPGKRPPRDLQLDPPPGLEQAPPPFLDAQWPDQTLATVIGQHCARLEPVAGEVPGVQLSQAPQDPASATEVPEGGKEYAVDPGHGAFVLSGGWDSVEIGSPFVIDAKGQSYAVLGPEAPANLGYEDYPVPVVPDSWVELFVPGVALSKDSALCPPTSQSGSSCVDAP